MTFEKIDLNNKEMLALTSKVASEIVKDYYDSILGAAQNDYMINKFQSIQAIENQIIKGYQYYLIKNESDILGFTAFYKRESDIYLSKLYLYKNHRGKGYAKQILDFVIDYAKEQSMSAIELNVNKHNESIAIYERLGFYRIRSEKNDIGCGYYMDDYVYKLDIE